MNMNKIVKYTIYALLATFFIFIILLFNYQKAISEPMSTENKNIVFTVSPGESVSLIADALSEAGLIKDKLFFRFYVKRENLGAKIKAGDYELSTLLSIKDIVRVMSNGETLKKDREIKIIEGWKIEDINRYLKESSVFKNDHFLEIAQKPKKDCLLASATSQKPDKSSPCYWDFLKNIPNNATLEGFLFPDTYRIFNDASPEDVLARLLTNFDKKLTPDMRAEIDHQGKSIYEVVTLASIIEKEVTSAKDMATVSGIFWNRMKNGQALESCATLAYILGVNKKQYSLEDTKINSPYNTYANKGLPPGPICNPGLNAIKAAIYPEKTDYYYFLSRSDNGGTVFSKTYNEHLMNKAKYLR